MATVVGESGAWRGIVRTIWRLGHDVRNPAEIEPLLLHLRRTLTASVDAKHAQYTQEIQIQEQTVTALRAERGFLRAVLNWFKIRGRMQAIAVLQADDRNYAAQLSANIGSLESLLHSPELAGAREEIAVITRLQRLPAEYTVLNDVHLRAERFMRFHGVPLQSAQVDHLVLSPAGVFVIETKLWSRQFADSGRYHDPFDQVQRAACLCYRLLRDRLGKIRVRSIIACAGSLPQRPPNSYVKVLRPEDLNEYITFFRRRELDPNQLAAVRQCLEQFQGP